jgi:hypothetical protein
VRDEKGFLGLALGQLVDALNDGRSHSQAALELHVFVVHFVGHNHDVTDFVDEWRAMGGVGEFSGQLEGETAVEKRFVAL